MVSTYSYIYELSKMQIAANLSKVHLNQETTEAANSTVLHYFNCENISGVTKQSVKPA